jgi:hypothetical protein
MAGKMNIIAAAFKDFDFFPEKILSSLRADLAGC